MNLFELSPDLPEREVVEPILPDKGILIERIVSTGQSSPPGFWYDQERDEWVALLQGQARMSWEDGHVRDIGPGDWVLIPAHQRHRVEWTSNNPPCIWLAVHGQIK
ncbi:MAG: cupin domain-containing protein [Veillonellales bacterium]